METKLQSLICMYNHYKRLAQGVWDLYPNITDAYLMYDHYMEYVDRYERELLALL